ncbi:MAG TPA: DedA family protein [Burkholderiales bacterium]|nr:DedA family protein [Burkholderiales bacterium]
MTTLQSLIETYGYLAVFAGTFLEGETVLILAGFAAQSGYLVLPLVMLVAFCGGLFGDQLYFFLGRLHGQRMLQRFPKLQTQAKIVDALLARYHTPLILAIRFLYGLRIAGPIVIGMSSVRTLKFVGLNMLGAAVWAVAIGGAGYLFGGVLQLMLADVKHYEQIILGVIALIGIAIWLIYRLRKK